MENFCDIAFGDKLAHASTGWARQKERYPAITEERMVEAAKRAVQVIVASGRKQVIVLDTGAAPCSSICEEICRRDEIDLSWFYFKAPLASSFLGMFRYFLSEGEWQEVIPCHIGEAVVATVKEGGLTFVPPEVGAARGAWLEALLPLVDLEHPGVRGARQVLAYLSAVKSVAWQQAFSLVLTGTRVQEIFSRPLIIFDENMHRGSTMLRSFTCMQCFCHSLDAKLFVYYVEAKKARNYPVVLGVFYDKSESEERCCYGMYHYEDRMDYIGYAYFFESGRYEKVSLETLAHIAPADEANANLFLEQLSRLIESEGLLDALHSLINDRCMASVITEPYCLRYMIGCLEEYLREDSLIQRYWYRVHYLYAPISKRGEFLALFWRVKHLFMACMDHAPLIEAYRSIRLALVAASARRFLARHHAFQQRLLEILNLPRLKAGEVQESYAMAEQNRY